MIDGIKASEHMQLGNFSREKPFTGTIEVAFVRALSAGEPDEGVRCSDTLAHEFLDWKYRLVQRPRRLVKALVELIQPGGYYYHAARTKHIDGLLAQAVREGITQFVVLGAGNDSRAYRMKELRGVRVFELDLPGTQARKRRILQRVFPTLPANVTFVPIDFGQQSVEPALLEHGYDPTAKTFFNWEGVSFCLERSDVEAILEFLRRASGPGSSIVFDYSLRSFNEGDHRTHGGGQLARWLRRHELQYKFGLDSGEVAGFLSKHGLRMLADLGPKDLEERYLRTRRGSVAGRVWGNFRIVHAERS
jgi:methyltransferase (TIGR00027 family)